MRFRNPSEYDFCKVGVQCAAGDTVDVPERIMNDPHKAALIRRSLVEVPPAPVSAPVIEAPSFPPLEPAAAPAEIRERFQGRRRR